MRPLLRRLRSSEGAEIAEAALVLPVVFLFLLGIIWFGRAFNIYSTIQQAAQQGALVAARPTCATCGNAFPANSPSSGSCPGTSPSVVCAVSAVMQASSLDPGQIVSNPITGCSSANNITICQNVLLNSSTPPQTCGSSPPQPTPSQICGTLVTFKYPFTFNISFAAPTINLTAQAQSRTEN